MNTLELSKNNMHDIISFFGKQLHRYTIERHPNGIRRYYLLDGTVFEEGQVITKDINGMFKVKNDR